MIYRTRRDGSILCTLLLLATLSAIAKQGAPPLAESGSRQLSPLRSRVSIPLREECPDVIEWRGDSRGISTAAIKTASVPPGEQGWRQVIWDLTKTPPKEYSSDGKWNVTPSELAPGTREMVSHGSGRTTLLWWLDYKSRKLGLFADAKSPTMGFVAARPELCAGGSRYIYQTAGAAGGISVNAWDVSTGKVETLKAVGQNTILWPAVSAEAGALAYVSGDDNSTRLIVESLHNGTVLYRSPPEAGGVSNQPAVSRSDCSFVYVTESNGNTELHKLLVPACIDRVIARGTGFRGIVSVRQTTGDIAVEVDGPDRCAQIRVYTKDGKLFWQSPASIVAMRPSFSPDGRYLAFCRSAKGASNREIIITGADLLAAEGWTTG